MTLRIATLAASALVLAGGAAMAQSSGMSSSDSMSKSSMSGMKMSKSDMKTMKMCTAMAHDAMMANSKCKMFMSSHPDMFNSDGTMKSGMSPQ